MKIRILSLAALTTAMISSSAWASSHREAPAIAQDPAVDITDLYVFKPTGERADTHVTFVMNVYPAQVAQAGPNWYRFADDALYHLNLDTNGDAIPDLTYRFKFNTLPPVAPDLPIAYGPGVQFDGNNYTYNLAQNYSVKKIERRYGRTWRRKTIARGVPVAPAHIGPATTDFGDGDPLAFDNPAKTDPTLADQNYATLAGHAVQDHGQYRLFAGPRNDPFFVDLGGVFDGLQIRVPGLSGTPKDSLAGANVMSIVFEVPVSDLRGSRIFGAWATTHKRQLELRSRRTGKVFLAGGWVQVSRLGNPLVNEVVIGFKDKDKFNAQPPYRDVSNFADWVLNPRLAGLLNALYGKDGGATAGLLEPITENDRADLVAAFVTGIPGINQIPGRRQGTGDMIRTNLDEAIGWPNGRNLKDDVVKTALIVLAECKVDAYGIGKYAADSINCNLDDGITEDDVTLGGSGQTAYFPYVGLPHSAYGVRD